MTSPTKQFLSYEGQVARLASRGMAFTDPQEAAAQLDRVNYYRLSAYWYPYRAWDDGKLGDRFVGDRVFALSPKLPRVGSFGALDLCAPFTRTFGMLSLIQFLLAQDGLRRTMLPAVIRSFPSVLSLSVSDLGAPAGWEESGLWS